MVSYDFEMNNYRDVLLKGQSSVLTGEMLKYSQSINPENLNGRTSGGLNLELSIHHIAYEIGFFSDVANPADMGSLIITAENQVYDENASWFEASTYWELARKAAKLLYNRPLADIKTEGCLE